MIEIVSIGDRLAEGRYELHSRFADVVNFSCRGALAAVASERVGPGPLNIVAGGVDFERVGSLQVGDSSLWLDDREYPISSLGDFSSGVEIHNRIDISRLNANLSAFEEALIASSHPKSLAFLLNPIKRNGFVTSFDKEFARRMEEGVGAIFGSDRLGGVGMIRGLGYGLTPSGDDFLSGMLLACNIVGRLTDADYSERIEEIYKIAIGGNLISNAGFLCAKNGWMTGRQKSIVSAILYNDAADVASCAKSLEDIGETSGTDWGVGFLMTMKDIYRLL